MFLTALAACLLAFAGYGKKKTTVEVFDFTSTYQKILTFTGERYQPRLTSSEEGGYVCYIENLTVIALPSSQGASEDKIVVKSPHFAMAISRNGSVSICRAGKKKPDAIDENICIEFIERLNLYFE